MKRGLVLGLVAGAVLGWFGCSLAIASERLEGA